MPVGSSGRKIEQKLKRLANGGKYIVGGVALLFEAGMVVDEIVGVQRPGAWREYILIHGGSSEKRVWHMLHKLPIWEVAPSSSRSLCDGAAPHKHERGRACPQCDDRQPRPTFLVPATDEG